MFYEIKDIKSAVSQCEIKAMVTAKSDVRKFGTGGMYINIELNDGEKIKLTCFGELNCKKLEKVKVSGISKYEFVYFS